MRLTLYSDYSLRVLLFLAVHPERSSSAREIAEAYGISLNHLVKVVHNLGKLGYIKTERGRGGGISLGHDPKEILLGTVVRQTEPDAGLVECFDPTHNTCPIDGACRLKGILADAMEAFWSVLDKHSVADLTGEHQRLVQILGISQPRPRTRLRKLPHA